MKLLLDLSFLCFNLKEDFFSLFYTYSISYFIYPRFY